MYSKLLDLYRDNPSQSRLMILMVSVFLAIYFLPAGNARFDNAVLEAIRLTHFVDSNAESAAQALGVTYEIEKVTDMNAIIDAGIMRTRGLAPFIIAALFGFLLMPEYFYSSENYSQSRIVTLVSVNEDSWRHRHRQQPQGHWNSNS
jgi:hypothetical protein